ncbi:MAG: AbrB/MazE/SpoVT family DNA-binding domain-containing protein, partial [Thiohalorhabdaceae bacterium]
QEARVMRITQKGQVTIPAEIREKLGLLPDTEVEFRLEDGRVVMEKASGLPRRGKRVVERLRGRATAELSTEEIMAMTRDRD